MYPGSTCILLHRYRGIINKFVTVMLRMHCTHCTVVAKLYSMHFIPLIFHFNQTTAAFQGYGMGVQQICYTVL